MKKTVTKDLSPEYRPDEKFLKYGAESLTSAELLAIILRTGSTEETSVDLARRLLFSESAKDESILRIYDYEISDLLKIRGVGKVKALQIKAVAELSRRIAISSTLPVMTMNEPSSIAHHYMESLRHLKKETVLLLILDCSCHLIKEIVISQGTVNLSLISAREVFLEALRYEGVSIILLHNHPSGSTEPSNADIMATSRILAAGTLIGIRLLDHIIIGDREYLSFREEGYLNEQ